MTGIQAQSHKIRIGATHQLTHLFRGFNVAGAMMVKDGTQSSLIVNAPGDRIHPLGKYVPFVCTEQRTRTLPGLRDELRHGPVLICKNNVLSTQGCE